MFKKYKIFFFAAGIIAIVLFLYVALVDLEVSPATVEKEITIEW